MRILAKDFSNKQYMTMLFHGFKYQTTESKRKRDNIMFHVWKSWKDYIKHKKFLMSANVAAL
jgi:predicted transcriptional regulator